MSSGISFNHQCSKVRQTQSDRERPTPIAIRDSGFGRVGAGPQSGGVPPKSSYCTMSRCCTPHHQNQLYTADSRAQFTRPGDQPRPISLSRLLSHACLRRTHATHKTAPASSMIQWSTPRLHGHTLPHQTWRLRTLHTGRPVVTRHRAALARR
eukprot:1444699-Prymnesium_polylepis.1